MKKNYYHKKRKETFDNIFEKISITKSQTVFTQTHIKEIQDTHGISMRMASYSLPKFINFLTSKAFLQELTFSTTDQYPNKKVWTSKYFEKKSSYEKVIEILQTLYPKGYFTHYTAMRYHKLTDQLPKNIYMNQEQQNISKESVMSVKSSITQTAIDNALQKEPRDRKKTLSLFNHGVYKIAGKNSNNIGVSSVYIGNLKIKITTIERILIDIVVHQEFAGGISEVLIAYQRAYQLNQSKENHYRFSLNKMIRILKKLDYIYPYHQAVGFLLESAGFESDKFKKEFEINHDFYLVKGIQKDNLDYIKRWRLYIPKHLQQLI